MLNLVYAGLRLLISALVMATLAGILVDYVTGGFWPTFNTALHIIVTGEVIVVTLLVLTAKVLKNADGRGVRIHEASEVDPADTRILGRNR
jgi:hypothetical protein